MTLIKIKPHRWSWKVFEAPGVEPVFPQKPQAIARNAEAIMLAIDVAHVYN